MTDEELDAIEARGKDPLNSFEDAQDGLETLGADAIHLVAEVRRLHKQSSAWADLADGMVAALGDPTTTEHVALAKRVREERDAALVDARQWIRGAIAAKCEYAADVTCAHGAEGPITWKQLLEHVDALDEIGRAFVEDVVGAAVRLVGVEHRIATTAFP